MSDQQQPQATKQGTFVLRRLVREEIDPRASARRRLVSAVLLGGNVTVRAGGDRHGDFDHVRACRRRGQTGCVVAFSTFNAPVPENALFGRTSDPKLQILCTNPAALGGGSAKLSPIYPSAPFAPSVIGIGWTLRSAICRARRPHGPRSPMPTAAGARTPVARACFRSSHCAGRFRSRPVPPPPTNLVRRQIRAYD